MIGSLVRRLWHWRGFLAETIKRDFTTRYAASSAGMAWHFVQPVTQILIYVLIFSQVMRARLPGSNDTLSYGLFICAGLLPWQLFAEVMTRATGMFVEYGAQIKKSAFPRSSLLAAVVASASINFALVWGIFVVLLVLLGRFPGWNFLAVFPLLLFGVLNVYLRDVGQLVAICLQFLFWLSPIVWPLEAVPAAFHPWLLLNPLAGVLMGLQGIIVSGQLPQWPPLLPAVLWCIGFMLVSVLYYRRLAPRLADEL